MHGGAVSPKEGLAFVKRHGIVLEAARGPFPSLAEAIAGGPIRGSWWGHPKGRLIFRAAQSLCQSPEVLVCKLIDDKVTYVHRRLWPALIKLAPRFRKAQLAKVWNEHTESGAHVSKSTDFPEWVPTEIMQQAEALSATEAEQLLAVLLARQPVKRDRTLKLLLQPASEHFQKKIDEAEDNRAEECGNETLDIEAGH